MAVIFTGHHKYWIWCGDYLFSVVGDSSMNKGAVCKRCGRCCFHLTPKGWEPCRHLKDLNTLKHRDCEIYADRLGCYVGHGFYCRTTSIYNIPDCPYNKKDQPDHPFWKDQKVL